jgi:hypothetical protein
MAKSLLYMMSMAIVLALAFIISKKKTNPALVRSIEVHKNSKHLEERLTKFKDVIGGDYEGYRNHIYRVLTYSLHYLNTDIAHFAEIQKFIPVIEEALVFHDIGLWTDKQLSYLEPSSFRAKEALHDIYSEEELTLLHNIIFWHHKVTDFEGEHKDIVNAVRKADWIDATMGLVNFGMPNPLITEVNAVLPESGFHRTLVEIGPRYYGYNVYKIITELITILKW